MMEELFDSEYLTQQYIKADRKKTFAEGKAEGRAEGIAEGEARGRTKVLDGIIANLRKLGMTDEQIKAAIESV